mmetsp:Transcript_9113/g.13384  ORF Transcript_9113/g.13384 Transcript_9113/m.13384 type:complete len:226 (+) Transcript_9113:659-1336(+)
MHLVLTGIHVGVQICFPTNNNHIEANIEPALMQGPFPFCIINGENIDGFLDYDLSQFRFFLRLKFRSTHNANTFPLGTTTILYEEKRIFDFVILHWRCKSLFNSGESWRERRGSDWIVFVGLIECVLMVDVESYLSWNRMVNRHLWILTLCKVLRERIKRNINYVFLTFQTGNNLRTSPIGEKSRWRIGKLLCYGFKRSMKLIKSMILVYIVTKLACLPNYLFVH